MRTKIVTSVKTGYNTDMTLPRIPLLILITSLLFLIAGCSGGEPYVYESTEFNRQSETYLKGIQDREQVTICYSKRASRPLDIAKLAMDECARFGKTARFSEQNYASCPLMTPVAAIYDCVNKTSSLFQSAIN